MNIKEYTFRLDSGSGVYSVTAEAVGNFIRCTQALGQFSLSIDGGPQVPFRLGAELVLKDTFTKLTVDSSGSGVDYPVSGVHPVRLIVGNGAIYRDARVDTWGLARIKESGAGSMESLNVVQPVIPGPDTQIQSIGGKLGQFRIVIRNTGSETLLVDEQTVAGVVRLSADIGLIIEPGETEEIPAGDYFPNNPMSLLVKAPAGATYTVTWYKYAFFSN